MLTWDKLPFAIVETFDFADGGDSVPGRVRFSWSLSVDCEVVFQSSADSLGSVDSEHLSERWGQDYSEKGHEHGDKWTAHVFRCPVRCRELFRRGCGP